MAEKFDEKLYDRRVVESNIKRGAIGAKDYERYLKTLGDDEGGSTPVDTNLGESGATPRSAEADEE